MDIYEFHQSGKTYSISKIKADLELSKDVQSCLVWLGLLNPPVDSYFGLISEEALKIFQTNHNCPQVGILDTTTVQRLIETDWDDDKSLFQPQLKLSNDLASRIIKYMQLKNYHISVRSQEYNIVYVEGMNADGQINSDIINHFNDQRIVIEIVNGVPTIRGNWEATTEPGSYWIQNPFSPKGTARIAFDQFKAWRVGQDKNQYPALRQVKPVTVHRDFNRDGSRIGDKTETGIFGIPQGHANNAPRHDIGRWSAGSMRGRTKAGHEEFMKIIMSDRRYKLNSKYLFETTIIPGDDLQDKYPFS